MLSSAFIEKLLIRLKSGDARSIHLNALPGNFARLDIYDLINIEPSLHLKFLDNLLTKNEFKFSITIEPALLNNKTADEKKIIQRISKRLNHLDYQNKEEFAEHGYHSFGFGYPLLIKRDPNNPDRILKAPLLIWHLNIEKDTSKNNTWTISRNENHPLIFNELLQSHFENVEKVRTEELEVILEDDFITEIQLNTFCKQLLEILNIPFDASNNIVTLLPCTNKETLENITKETAWIRWSGVFGLYKLQKQSIIKDMELLLNSDNSNEMLSFFKGEILSPILLDPSQENVLYQLSTSNNIIIQGPPGTGKSQSLTGVITQALLNQKKVLVVCEKRTAMEVLYNNLKKENLHHLCVLIEDVYSDRKTIVDTVRDLIENSEQPATRFRFNEYELLRSRFLSLQKELNDRINFSEKIVFGDDNWTELLSKSHELNQNAVVLEKANSLNKVLKNSDYTFQYEEFLLISERIKRANELYVKIIADDLFDEYSKVDITHESDCNKIIIAAQNQHELSNTLSNKIISNSIEFTDNYNHLTGWRSLLVHILSVFVPRFRKIKQLKKETIADYQKLMTICIKDNYYSYTFPEINSINSLIDLFETLKAIKGKTQYLVTNKDDFPHYFAYRKYVLQQDAKTQVILDALRTTECNNWQPIFETYYLNQTILKIALENGIKDDIQYLYESLQQTDAAFKQKLSEKINTQWFDLIREKIIQTDLSEIKYLYNQRKNKQFASKNSLRKIIHQDFDFFTTLFPVMMVNPTVCTSILPLQENLFDFIILDEASQLRLEDTFSSLLRGKTKIISGDKHQMPPSNFFGNDVIFWNEKEDEASTEYFLAESRSLLEYADDANFKSTYLDYHYRSLHPDLISFSNHAFYQSRLIPMPEQYPYQAIYYKNIAGIYSDGTNPKEADEIVDFIFRIKPTEEIYPAIGIATFNIFQRNLIMDKLYEAAYSDKSKSTHFQALLNKGLFVKNLENIQGDERDMMILSTTFGKDKEGKFRQTFGPLTQEKGYQLLNVIITRAKHSLYIFTSIPEEVFLQFEEEILQKGNSGKGIFYAYLSYVKACSENNEVQQEFIRNTLQKNSNHLSTSKNKSKHNILIQHVHDTLQHKLSYNIKRDYQLGGFSLDIVIFKDERPVLFLDFEQTQNYHPEVAYRVKLHRQQIATKYGIQTYQLWAYQWWNNFQQELQNISSVIDSIY